MQIKNSSEETTPCTIITTDYGEIRIYEGALSTYVLVKTNLNGSIRCDALSNYGFNIFMWNKDERQQTNATG